MSQALFSVASGAGSHEKRLDILANNLSNFNTAGYKQDRLIFRIPENAEETAQGIQTQDFLYSPPPLPAGTTIDFSQGDLQHTQNPLNVALSGQGFFCIETPDGRQYTRKGSLALNEDGVLGTKEGYPVLGDSGEIKISGQDMRIDENGDVYADGSRVGSIKVVEFSNPHLLRKVGDTLYKAPAGSNEVATEGTLVKQGFLEGSNVNPVRAMTEMIDIMRGYESYQKVIQFLDGIARKSISEVGKL
ncbi:MAG: flagellar basal-body rod protein FlgF [Desulfatiglandaceae bacterium]